MRIDNALQTYEVQIAKAARLRAIRSYAERVIDLPSGAEVSSRASAPQEGKATAPPAPSMLPLRSEPGGQAAGGPTRRMRRSLPVLVSADLSGVCSVTPVQINEAGQVPCAKRMWDGIARDRCAEYQARDGCTCQLAQVVVDACALRAEMEARDAAKALARQRLPGNRLDSMKRYPPWVLTCGYRGCGKTFVAQRRWGQKPRYHSKACQNAEREARRKDWAEGRNWPEVVVVSPAGGAR